MLTELDNCAMRYHSFNVRFFYICRGIDNSMWMGSGYGGGVAPVDNVVSSVGLLFCYYSCGVDFQIFSIPGCLLRGCCAHGSLGRCAPFREINQNYYVR
jgi:hypothetical protein